jgi:hypothetical protein
MYEGGRTVLEGHRCPHTGIINYFSKAEPRLAIGCIIENPPGRFVWHCHVADDHCGAASDRRAAESELRRAVRSGGKRSKAQS